MSEITVFDFDAVQLDRDLETLWCTQRQIADFFMVDTRTVSEHLANIFAEEELLPEAVVRKFRITAADGKSYQTLQYTLDAVISVGYRVNSTKGTRFRQAATKHLKALLTGQTAPAVSQKQLSDVLDRVISIEYKIIQMSGNSTYDTPKARAVVLPPKRKISPWAKVVNGAKACSRCHETKRLDEFSPQKRGAGGKGSKCRPCNAAETRARRYGLIEH